MASLLIENVPDELLERLRETAAARGQGLSATAVEGLTAWLTGRTEEPSPEAVIPCNLPRPAGGRVVTAVVGGGRPPTQAVVSSGSDDEYGPPYIIPDFDSPLPASGVPVTPVEKGPAKVGFRV